MKIVEFIRDFFGSKSEILLNEKMIDISTQIAVQEFAIETAINLISGCISKCEFQTFMNNKEIKEDEYYLWNYEPNKNQNSTEFIQELVSKLLRNNECLIVESNGQLIIADSFNQNEYALVENIFEDVTRKDFTFKRKFRMSEVLYFKLNNKDIRILLSSLMDSYDNLLNLAVGKYKRSGGRKGVIKLDSILKGDETKKKEIEDLFTRKFKNYFEAENAIVDLPKGVEYEEKNGEGSKKSTSELVDIQNLIKEAFERAAQAFKIPPSLLRGDIADIEKITDNFLTFCIDPIVDMISEEINRKRYGKTFVLKGTFIRIDTTCIKHIDIFAIAEKIDKLISTGMYSIDGLRRKVKDIALNEEWSGKHWITKNYSEITQIDSGGGGEGDE
ncbi:MAG: phage portal protein [Clostridium sp.]|uniref:phage portal protein n=1 Tax=Clostridium sp. TaxID=1506 RepID=UPI002673DCFD|nr:MULTISPECIES: phage portal protein [Clostridium]MDU4318479.1 phage portal protein [Clostridium sp.]